MGGDGLTARRALTHRVWYMLKGSLRTSRASRAASRRDFPSFVAAVVHSRNRGGAGRPRCAATLRRGVATLTRGR